MALFNNQWLKGKAERNRSHAVIPVTLSVSEGWDADQDTAAAITITRQSGDKDHQYLRISEVELQELVSDLLVLATDAAIVGCLRRIFEKRKEAEEKLQEADDDEDSKLLR